MNLLKFLPYLFLIILFTACGGQKDTSDCDDAGGGGTFGDSRYDCPAGPPSNSDLSVSNLDFGKIEAGAEEYRQVLITHNGSNKIYDFNVTSTGPVSFTNCPERFLPKDSCIIEFKIEENLSSLKTYPVKFSDRTGGLTRVDNINYEIISSYPVNNELNYAIQDIDYRTKRIIVGPLLDRFGNTVKENYSVSSSRKISNSNVGIFLQDQLLLDSKISGSFSFFVQTLDLEDNKSLDAADISIVSPRVYDDNTISSSEFSVVFFSNRPTISSTPQIFNFIEDSFSNSVIPLFEGEDQQGRALSYLIEEFPKNGVLSNCLIGNQFASLVNCVYTPNKNYFGPDTFTYKVNNGIANSFDSAEVVINVSGINDAPILLGSKSVEVNENSNSIINLEEAFDPDQDSLSYVITQNPTKGSLSCAGTLCSYITNNQLGSDSFKYKARDLSGLESGEYIIFINIKNVNDKPVLGGSEVRATTEDTPVNFSLSAASDPDGDSIVYEIKNAPSKGVLSNCLNNTADLTCTYTPNLNEDSADSFSYVAIDSKGLESDPRQVTITIAQVNDAPSFTSLYQEEQTVQNSSINFSLMSATDPENNTISYQIVDFPSQGTLQGCLGLGASGLLCQYNPPAGQNNISVTFTYRAQDNLGALSSLRTVKVIIKNTNDSPVLTGTLSVNTTEDVSVNFNLIQGSDTETVIASLRYLIQTPPTNGTISGCADQAGSTGRSDITCTYKPNLDYNGADSFSYVVQDGRGNNSTPLTVNITIVANNDAPRFDDSDSLIVSMDEDVPSNFTLPSAIDPDLDPIIYSINVAPQHGTLSPGCFTSVGMSNGCRYTPALNYFGEDSFSYKASDPSLLNSVKNVDVTIIPLNDAPVVVNNSYNAGVAEDETFNFSLSAATDVDTQQFEITYDIIDFPLKGVLYNCLGINDVPGLNCSYISFSNEVGVDVFRYRAFDGQAYSNVSTITLNVSSVNDAPFFNKTKLGPFRVERGNSLSFNIITAKDIENDTISYEIVTPPANGSLINCFSGNPLSCTYQADSNATGTDSIVYRAKDTQNSINTVQVDFVIEDKRNNRFFKLPNASTDNVAQKMLTTVDSEIYRLGESLVYNAGQASSNYSSNKLIIQNPNASTIVLNTFAPKNKTIIYKNELIIFNETSTVNQIKVINELGQEKNVSYAQDLSVIYPIVYNNNIYAGSTKGTLYKMNLLELEGQKQYYLEQIVKKAALGITADRIVQPIGVFNNELYFIYSNDANFKFFAKIDNQGNLVKISELADFSEFSIIDNIFGYEPNTSFRKIYFTAGDSSSKRLYALDINAEEIEDSFETISTSIISQKYMVNPSLFLGDTYFKDLIMYYNPNSKKVVGLQPAIGILVEYNEEDVSSFAVSKDKKKISIIKSNGDIFVTNQNPSLGLQSVSGISGEKSFGLDADRFLIKRKDSVEWYILDSSSILEQVISPNNFNYTDKVSINSAGDFFYSPINTITGIAYEIFEFKNTLEYKMSKNSTNIIPGLIATTAGQSAFLISNPSSGTISDCLGINSSPNSVACKYTPNTGFIGQDSFRYRINNGLVDKEFKVFLNIPNNKPEINSVSKKTLVAELTGLNKEILDYTLVDDEIIFSSKTDNNNYQLQRFNDAEGLNVIAQGNREYSNLFTSGSRIFYSVKNTPHEIHFYDSSSKTTVKVFEDTTGGTLFKVQDIIVVNNFLFAIAKDYGNPAFNKLIKINLSNNTQTILALPTGYENGKLIVFNNTFYLETTDKFAKYDNTNDVFIQTTNLANIQPGKGFVIDNRYISFITTKTSGSLLFDEIKVFDPQTQSYITSNDIILLGYRLGTVAFPIFHPNGTPVLTFETVSSDFSNSFIEVLRRDISTLAQRITFFNGRYNNNTQIKIFNDDLYFISRNSLWQNVDFYKYGTKKKNYVLNGSISDVLLDAAIDKDLSDNIVYEITQLPTKGTISNCLGLNGSGTNDLSCEYAHTDTTSNSVIDSFKYRAFDGSEYSLEKLVTLDIRNNSPVFANNNPMSINVFKNIQTNIQLKQATDPENNNIYYIIEDLPTKGVISSCLTSAVNLNLSSSICRYTPNNNQIGADSFSYRAYDGLGYSVKITVNITISNSNNPVFLTSSQKDYVPKTSSTYRIYIDTAFDPQGLPITYSIVQNPTGGTLSNCFSVDTGRMVCDYTPNNPNSRYVDSFTYRANNGSLNSNSRTVNISVTGSNMNGNLGKLSMDQFGISLLKQGNNNLTAISSLPGYSYNNTTKVLTLPSNREYQFESIDLDSGSKIVFKTFSPLGLETYVHGWTKLYSQSSCFIDGEIVANSGQTTGTTLAINELEIDGLSLNNSILPYPQGVFGGKAGGSSSTEVEPGIIGSPGIFKAANGEIPFGAVGNAAQGGKRGLDGTSIYVKCLDNIDGFGSISVDGVFGENGQSGTDGYFNNNISLGGFGGAGGGNGGHGGKIVLRTEQYNFTGILSFSGGVGGAAGIGGNADLTVDTPFEATNGSDGEDGLSGAPGSCLKSGLTGSLNACF